MRPEKRRPRLTFSTRSLVELRVSINPMSTSLQSSNSNSNFQAILDKALKEYKRKTGKDLITHPLAEEINSCDSPEAIFAVLEGKANELNQSQSSDGRLTKWLTSTVNVLNALSATFGQGVGMVNPSMLPYHNSHNVNVQVFPPTKIIFSGINILLVVSFFARSLCVGCDNTISRRRRGTRLRAAMPLSNSSRKSPTSSYASKPIPKSHRLSR